MKLLIILISSLLLNHSVADDSKMEKIRARITYYYPEAPFYKKVSAPNVKCAISGVTIAAHPKFKFGTKIVIPALAKVFGDSLFVVQDRGPAVTKKTASKGKGYVFDVYVDSRSIMNKFKKQLPMWMDVYIEKS